MASTFDSSLEMFLPFMARQSLTIGFSFKLTQSMTHCTAAESAGLSFSTPHLRSMSTWMTRGIRVLNGLNPHSIYTRRISRALSPKRPCFNLGSTKCTR